MFYPRQAWIVFLHSLVVLLLSACGRVPELNVVATLDEVPGNITVTPDKRIIFSLHQFFSPDWRVAEWTQQGIKPFPNPGIASANDPDITLHSVLGLQSDSKGIVWMLDNGMRASETPKLVAWDTRQNKLHKVIMLPDPTTPADAFVNDLAVDETHDSIYITDPAGGDNAALIVVDISSGDARRVLQGHQSVVPEELDLIIAGEALEIRQADGSTVRPRVGANPIALDTSNEWLYYGPMHGTSLYRIRVNDLLDREIEAEALADKVERYGRKPISDGISIDSDGNVYITDLANNAIGVIDHSREYRIYITDERLSWPDALSFGPDDRLYTVSNQLHKSALLHGGEETAKPPYYIFSFTPLAAGVSGR
jgi:sugar lactone lactonase YvrE